MHTVVLNALSLSKSQTDVTIWRHVLEDYAKVDGKLDCPYENFESVNKDTLI